jgi:hypothetical protein
VGGAIVSGYKLGMTNKNDGINRPPRQFNKTEKEGKMKYKVLVRVDRQWLHVTGINPTTLTPSKDAYLFRTNKEAQEVAEKFNEALVEVVND